jgi:hypothetical protein
LRRPREPAKGGSVEVGGGSVEVGQDAVQQLALLGSIARSSPIGQIDRVRVSQSRINDYFLQPESPKNFRLQIALATQNSIQYRSTYMVLSRPFALAACFDDVCVEDPHNILRGKKFRVCHGVAAHSDGRPPVPIGCDRCGATKRSSVKTPKLPRLLIVPHHRLGETDAAIEPVARAMRRDGRSR